MFLRRLKYFLDDFNSKKTIKSIFHLILIDLSFFFVKYKSLKLKLKKYKPYKKIR